MAEQDGKRVIEQQATSEVFADDWFLKDSVTEGTTKISSENLKAFINGDIDLSAEAISYDNTSSELEADNVQDAIDEVLETAGKVDDVKVDGESVVDENKVANIDLSVLKIVRDIPNTPTAIATFSDGADLPMPKLEVGIEAVQDLHGYDAPWVGGAGKNKLKVTATSQTIAGVTVTVKDDGTFIANGTATQNISLQLSRKSVSDTPLPEGQLIMTGCPSGGSTSSYCLTCWRTNSGNANDVGNGVTFAYQSDWDFVVSLVITSGTTCNNLTFKPMIRLATETDATFAPYSNICPISGWDEVNVSVCGKNLVNISDKTMTSPGYVFAISGLNIRKGIYTFSAKTTTSASMSIAVYGNGVAFINTGFNGKSISFTATDTITDIRLYTSGAGTYEEMMLEEGTTPTAYEPYNGQTITIDLDGTRYGGKVDLVSGVMTVDRAIVDISTFTWTSITGGIYAADLLGIAKTYPNGVPNKVIFEKYQSKPSKAGGFYPDEPNVISLNSNGYLYTVADTSPTGQCVYELATPLTIQLPTTVVKSLRGENNISADSGDVRDGKYIADASLTIASLDARITALENQ